MNKLWLILLCTVSHQCLAQTHDTLPGRLLVSARAQYGFIIAHRPTVSHLQEKHSKGLEMEFSKPLEGNHHWQQPFLLPSYAAAYQYINLGTDILGAGHALTLRILFPLNRSRFVKSAISSGIGIGYIENVYDRYDNYKNVAIGSHLNAVVSFSYRASVMMSKKTSFDVGLSFTHFSNGSVRQPNLGVNLPAAQAGVSHYIGKPLQRTFQSVPDAERIWINKLFAGAGLKGVDVPTGTNIYGITAITYLRARVISHKSRVGAGLDAFYDRSLPFKLESVQKKQVEKSIAFRGGIYASYALTAGKVMMFFENGIYIYDRYKEDGLVYSRVGVDYAVTDTFIVGFHLKSHFAKADYFEYGIGYLF